MGADVIIGGRSSDAAIFAAAAIHEGFPEGNAYYPGKILDAPFAIDNRFTFNNEVFQQAGFPRAACAPRHRSAAAFSDGEAEFSDAAPEHEILPVGEGEQAAFIQSEAPLVVQQVR